MVIEVKPEVMAEVWLHMIMIKDMAGLALRLGLCLSLKPMNQAASPQSLF